MITIMEGIGGIKMTETEETEEIGEIGEIGEIVIGIEEKGEIGETEEIVGKGDIIGSKTMSVEVEVEEESISNIINLIELILIYLYNLK